MLHECRLTRKDAVEQLNVVTEELALIDTLDGAQHQFVLVLVWTLALKVGCRHDEMDIGALPISQLNWQVHAFAHCRIHTCCPKHGHDRTHAIVVVLLAGELLAAQAVSGHNLAGTVTCLQWERHRRSIAC